MCDKLCKTQQELQRLREYEAATRDTICWGVKCVHEAKALDIVYANERLILDLKETIYNLAAIAADYLDTSPSGSEKVRETIAKALYVVGPASNSAASGGTVSND